MIRADLHDLEGLQFTGQVKFQMDTDSLEARIFQQELEAFAEQTQEQIESQVRIDSVALGVAAGATGAASFGYGLWVLKGGSLLASMMSTLPNAIDPLPVLERTRQAKTTRHLRRKAKFDFDDADEKKISSLLQ
jgi:hypothetical protein